MGQDESKTWSTSVAKRIGKNIQQARKMEGMSAQNLSDECALLGYSIPRSTIANIESGRKETVSLQELLVIAGALDVPALSLIYSPFDAASEVAALPQEEHLSIAASELFSANVVRESRYGQLHDICGLVWALERAAAKSLVDARIAEESPRLSPVLPPTGLSASLDPARMARDRELAMQAGEPYRKAAYFHVLSAYRWRQDLTASGVPVWEEPSSLAAVYAQVRADDDSGMIHHTASNTSHE